MVDLLTDAQFDMFRKTIYDESGITFSESNRTILDSRLKERLREKSLSNVEDYYKLILSDREEMKMFLDSVTTNLTRFFRNQPHFDALSHYVIPKIVELKKNAGQKTVKIWSAGCSTGEEPYTIAMVLKTVLPPTMDFEIMASDISLKSLMVGKQGYYPEARIVGIPPDYLTRFFTKIDGGYQVKEELKSIKEELGMIGDAKSSDYQKFKENVYKWMLSDKDTRQVITAIYIYSYLIRKEEDKKDV